MLYWFRFVIFYLTFIPFQSEYSNITIMNFNKVMEEFKICNVLLCLPALSRTFILSMSWIGSTSAESNRCSAGGSVDINSSSCWSLPLLEGNAWSVLLEVESRWGRETLTCSKWERERSDKISYLYFLWRACCFPI